MSKKDFTEIKLDLEAVQHKHKQEISWFYPTCPKCADRIPLSKNFTGGLLCPNCNTQFLLLEGEKKQFIKKKP